MKTKINIPDLTNKQSLSDFMIKLYPDQKDHVDKFSFNDLLSSIKRILIHFNKIHSNKFELVPDLTNKEQKLNILFEYKLSNKVSKYMRKNPHQVYKNYKKKKYVFGRHNIVSNTYQGIDTNMKIWKELYDREQLVEYENN